MTIKDKGAKIKNVDSKKRKARREKITHKKAKRGTKNFLKKLKKDVDKKKNMC